MNFLVMLGTKIGVNLEGCDTDEKMAGALMAAIDSLNATASCHAALMAKIGAKTSDEAMAVLSTMVKREDFAALEKAKADVERQLVLLEGQMTGRLTKADCEGDGWALQAAMQAPDVLRNMLKILPPKVATGSAIKETIAGLETRTHDGEQAVKTMVIDGTKYSLTDLTKDYGDKDIENLRDMIARFGAAHMAKEGYIVAI